MTNPQRPGDEGDIADTQMFRRFVAEPQPTGSNAKVWAWVGAIVALLVIALIVWLLVR